MAPFTLRFDYIYDTQVKTIKLQVIKLMYGLHERDKIIIMKKMHLSNHTATPILTTTNIHTSLPTGSTNGIQFPKYTAQGKLQAECKIRINTKQVVESMMLNPVSI